MNSFIKEKGILFAIILFGSWIGQSFMPWWVCAVIAFAVSFLLAKSGKQAFFIGFLSLAILWGIGAAYWQIASQGILANKVASIFQLPNGAILAAVSALVAGFVGGNAALSGYLVKDLFKK